ncbi:protein adenylyltransferase SelO [Austwickia chelonae]|uniref:protein adenylyltransferase SelO n=1 Tax=Austwickia chelonae TaxID=100225 RepID=UPI000E2579CD|nr:YdiU family protein [Austwickia chelonae]
MTDRALPLPLDHSYARDVPSLSLRWRARPVDPSGVRLLAVNDPLAQQLGLDPQWLRSPAGLAFLTGRSSEEVPAYAQAYAGHQFGGYSPQLGDGRALLLGEVTDRRGCRQDLHLKGSGATPFARRGDGRAVVGPMLREYLVGEAMHALGVPTTRALAVVATGDPVVREGSQPGAVLCRVASSHLRVGTFQYAAALGDPGVLRALADHASARHHRSAAEAENPYLALYSAVVRAQAELVAAWMGVGFVHGVLNTDNVAISGEGLDYGPCAFMDVCDPATVFSSIDQGGRYAYGSQPGVTQWNLARLGEALLPLIDESAEAAVESATEVLKSFTDSYRDAFTGVMAAKLGVPAGALAGSASAGTGLVEETISVLTTHRVDFTSFFRGLCTGTARELFDDPGAYDRWAARRDALRSGPVDDEQVQASMSRANPVYIPRNHRVEEVLAAAAEDDLAPFERLLAAVTRPFEERPELVDLAGPGPVGGPPHVTFCGT